MKIIFKYLIIAQILLLVGCDKSTPIEIRVSLDNHIFTPAVLHAPTKQKIILIVENNDATVEEFDSISLKREKILPPKSSVRITLPPLKEGEYDFIGEFHEETAKGKIIISNKEVKND